MGSFHLDKHHLRSSCQGQEIFSTNEYHIESWSLNQCYNVKSCITNTGLRVAHDREIYDGRSIGMGAGQKERYYSS